MDARADQGGHPGPGEWSPLEQAADAADPALPLDELPDGVVVADETGTVVAFNRAAERITGIAANDALGKPLRDALPLEDLDGRSWWVCTDPYGGLRTRIRQVERPLLLPGGQEVLVTATYVRNRALGPAGPLERLVVGIRDSRARTRLERSRADLVSTVAHELRSPLTSVKGFTATLLAKWERFTDEQKRLMLETVNHDADRVTRLISELLDTARIESGRLELRRSVVDLGETARHVVEGQVAAGEPEERFVVAVAPDLPEVWADPDKVAQILGNLVENAVRHGAGAVTITIEPDTASGDEGAVVTVRDEGDGVPPEQARRVFTKFWRGGTRGGTGLGLFIVRGLVEAHGGTVALARSRSGGAEFRFTLPASRPGFLDTSAG